MKKLLISAGVVSLMFIGCASKKIDTCSIKKQTCLAECKVSYPDEGVKYKACVAKCYTIYSGCKTGKAIKEGYEKTKEYIKEKTN